MECTCLLETAIKEGDIRKTLFRGSTHKDLIIELQRTLFELGFSRELNWNKFGADGIYGNSTTAAVAAFAEKNNIKSDGTKITKQLAKLIVERHDFLSSMYLLWTLHKSDLRTKYYISRGTKVSIVAIQTLLYELGYGKQLKFEKFGADGVYGNAIRSAVKAFAKANKINSSDGDLLSRDLINAFIKNINKFYGKNWSDLALNHTPSKKSPLIIYQGSQFIGRPCEADVEFLPMLEKINDYAKAAEVEIVVTSSFRTTTNVKGAIVPPSTTSNHLVGHGIDMNLKYGNNKRANSKVLTKYPNVPAPVKMFLKSIIDDSDLRWGGNFNTKDPVHIDDGLNRKNKSKWKRRYKIMQEWVQLGGK